LIVTWIFSLGGKANRSRTYEQNEMVAAQVVAWPTRGATDLANCDMLCVMQNRAKGNR
jgi:hypothetical protein